MHRSRTLLMSVVALAGCAGHPAAPSSPAPSAVPAAPAADPGSLSYAAGSGRYRFEQTMHVTQDVMGQVVDGDSRTMLLVSAALAPSAGGLSAAFTVDSAAFTATGAIPVPDATAGSQGKTWRAALTTQGRPVSFTPPDTTVSGQTSDMFREFLPAIPASLTPGTSWMDTVRLTPGQPGMTIRTESVRRHRVVGWETHDGVRALKIATTSTVTVSGEGESQGQQLRLSGTGSGTGERFISSAGVYLGGSVSDSSNVTVSVVSVGVEVPVRQVRHSTTTRLP